MFLNETLHPYADELRTLLLGAYVKTHEEFYEDFEQFRRKHNFSEQQAARTYAYVCDLIPVCQGVPDTSKLSRCLWKGIGH